METHLEDQPTADPDGFLRGLFAGVDLSCLAIVIIAGSILLGLN